MPLLSRPTIVTAALLAALAFSPAAQARDPQLEAGLRRLGDVSDFYRAFVYSGVADELQPGGSYTILAPTDSAFADLDRTDRSCFWSADCRRLAAGFVRAHIIVGRHSLPGMARKVALQTGGHSEIEVQEPYKDHYTIDGYDVLSATNAGHSVIYRVDGILLQKADIDMFMRNAPGSSAITSSTSIVTPHPDVIDQQNDPTVIPGVNADRTTVKKTVTYEDAQ